MPGKSGSGGSETQNFCYDEQDRLVWVGNSGTQPAAGNGTCGSGTLSSNLSGAAYGNSFVYTHLGQLWQGPLNGGNTQYQYLYCNSTAPHQLNGMYPIGTTCSNLSGAVYKTSYDNWGNATSRTYNGTSTTQSFDLLDQLVKWNSGTTQKQWYAYNTSGERVLLRSTTSSATTMTVYAFGAEEYTYDGSGNLQSSTHYYDMGGRLIGELTGGSTPATNLFLTDELGSVLTTFSNVQNSAAVQGNQAYGPYGAQRYNQGSMGTNKGYTGQYADPLTGFDYYNARYYDPVSSVFLSADCTQGNMQGMNPYAYVGGNPETNTDPTGEMYAPPGGSGGNGLTTPSSQPQPAPSCAWYNPWCGIQQQIQVYQNAWNNTVNDFKAAWSDEVHFAQQTQETITRTVSQGISVAHIVIGVAIGVAVGVGGYVIWRLTHPQAKPWADLQANEGIPHTRYTKNGKLIPSKQHVLRGHVDASKSHLQYLAIRHSRNETSFYDEYAAQWAVDDALQNMTSADKQKLKDMIDNPGKGGELVLNGTLDEPIGYGYRYNKDGTTTYVSATTHYRVIIAVDADGNPFIVTAYPTL